MTSVVKRIIKAFYDGSHIFLFSSLKMKHVEVCLCIVACIEGERELRWYDLWTGCFVLSESYKIFFVGTFNASDSTSRAREASNKLWIVSYSKDANDVNESIKLDLKSRWKIRIFADCLTFICGLRLPILGAIKFAFSFWGGRIRSPTFITVRLTKSFFSLSLQQAEILIKRPNVFA